ncbi:bacterio-opsin activator domain-containing protein [Haladaptatus halobius]|uniref:bacterio-opsin activator domain-containing protein n=1 Tax=Haladaptatus halobius TaxID=2884875 RepID=UPI001D0BE1BE|nr:bacterio-opsin activator domain-containing protein [Haladaptatus halobius]
MTTTEVADEFDCTDRTIYNKLDALVDEGVLETKKVGARGRVWWRPSNGIQCHDSTDGIEHPHRALESAVDQLYKRDLSAVYTLDADLRLTYLNERAEAWLGITESEVRGEFIWDVFEYDESADEAFHDALDSQDLAHFVTSFDQCGRWFDINVYPSDSGLSIYFTDITERKKAEKDLRKRAELDAFRITLTDELRPIADPVEIQHEAARVLGEQLDVDRAYYSEVLADENTNLVHADYYGGDVPSVVGEHQLDEYGEYVVDGFQTGDTLVVNDVATDSELRGEERAAYQEMEITSCIGVPLVKNSQLTAYFVVTQSTPREWTETEIAMVEETAERTWAAVERARAEQALRENEERLRQASESLERLNTASRELIDANTETISDRVAELTRDVLSVEYAALWRYDEAAGELREDTSHTALETDSDAVRLPDEFSDQVWQTFIGDDLDVDNDLNVPESMSSKPPLRSRVLVPLGRHGVICAGSTRPKMFDERTVDLVETVAATIETAWDRADSEQELLRRNEELTRLDQLNTLIRAIDQALVQAGTVTEIDQSVCERLADSDLYEFAWIGEFDAVRGTVEPRQWAGIDSSIVEDRTITIGDSTTDQNPVATAVRTRDTQIVADIATDRRIGSCREDILEQGARSCISIPLEYEETLYGALTVYAAQPHPEERNQRVLDELGQTVAHAINAAEKQETVQTDNVVELTIQIQEPGTVLARLARNADVQLQFKGIVPVGNGSSHVFFTGSQTAADTIQTAGTNLAAITTIARIAEHGENCLFRVTVSGSPLASQLATQKGAVRTLTFDRTAAIAVVDLPSTTDVRTYIDDLQRTYSSVKLTSRRSCDRLPESVQDVPMAIKEPLTDRQEGVLKLAYLSGFFESPRESTGQEIADMLDVSPPTFTQHLRAAQQKVFALAFDKE